MCRDTIKLACAVQVWLELAVQELTVKSAGTVQANGHHLGGLKVTMVGVFTPQKSACTKSQGLWDIFLEEG